MRGATLESQTRLTLTADTEEDAPFSSNKQDLRRKVHYARASDPDFLLDPRLYKKVRFTSTLCAVKDRR